MNRNVVLFALSLVVSAKHQIDEESTLYHLIGVEGNTHLAEGDFTRAERAFRTLVRSSPELWTANYAMGSSLLNQCRSLHAFSPRMKN